eukprot:6401906-Pyramimonas_sp.AAC.1
MKFGDDNVDYDVDDDAAVDDAGAGAADYDDDDDADDDEEEEEQQQQQQEQDVEEEGRHMLRHSFPPYDELFMKLFWAVLSLPWPLVMQFWGPLGPC